MTDFEKVSDKITFPPNKRSAHLQDRLGKRAMEPIRHFVVLFRPHILIRGTSLKFNFSFRIIPQLKSFLKLFEVTPKL